MDQPDARHDAGTVEQVVEQLLGLDHVFDFDDLVFHSLLVLMFMVFYRGRSLTFAWVLRVALIFSRWRIIRFAISLWL